jgi:replicative superfamily II helicase
MKQLKYNFASVGIKSIHPWRSMRVFAEKWTFGGGKNLVFAAPTCAGKSFMTDILMLKKVIEMQGRKHRLFCLMLHWFERKCGG